MTGQALNVGVPRPPAASPEPCDPRVSGLRYSCGVIAVHTEMARIPAGRFRMGCERAYPEEGPVREVELATFLIDRGPVTVTAFAGFVAATGYVTVAERTPDRR